MIEFLVTAAAIFGGFTVLAWIADETTIGDRLFAAIDRILGGGVK